MIPPTALFLIEESQITPRHRQFIQEVAKTHTVFFQAPESPIHLLYSEGPIDLASSHIHLAPDATLYLPFPPPQLEELASQLPGRHIYAPLSPFIPERTFLIPYAGEFHLVQLNDDFDCATAQFYSEDGDFPLILPVLPYYDKVFRRLERLAEQGNAPSMTELALCYLNGIGHRRSILSALHWLEKAAALGSSLAHFHLGRLYFEGELVPHHPSLAIHHLEQALPLSNAYYYLGILLQSEKHLQLAGDEHPDALYELGQLAETQNNIPLAQHYYALASSLNHPLASIRLHYLTR